MNFDELIMLEDEIYKDDVSITSSHFNSTDDFSDYTIDEESNS